MVAHGLASSLEGMRVVLGFAHVVLLTGGNQQSAGRIAREVADVTLTESDLFSLIRPRKLSMRLMDRLDASYRAIMLWNSAARVRRGGFSCRRITFWAPRGWAAGWPAFSPALLLRHGMARRTVLVAC